MSITYYGSFNQLGCTVDGINKGEEKLKDVFDFKYSLYENLLDETGSKALYENTVCEYLNRLKQTIKNDDHGFPVVIGGDHSLGIASVSAAYKEGMHLIWIDAHGDHNTIETSISKRIHGMPVAVLEGLGDEKLNAICEGNFLNPDHIYYFGLRSLDEKEILLMQEKKVHMYPMSYINEVGADKAIDQVIQQLKGKKLYISFDLDCLDPEIAPGVSIPECCGLLKEDAYALLDKLFDNSDVLGMDLVEYNPTKDINDKTLNIVREIKSIIESKKG